MNKVVIVGSGLGGLLCGAVLAREGYSVKILEKNRQTGGCLQCYSRSKRLFDSAVHYVGQLSPGQDLYRIFSWLGIMDRLRMQQLDKDGFDRVAFGEEQKEYCFAQGYEAFGNSLKEDFPEETASIDRYCSDMEEWGRRFSLQGILGGSSLEFSAGGDQLISEYFIQLTANTRLRGVLAASCGLHMGHPDETPFYVHALIMNSYIESSWRFLGGSSQLAKQLGRLVTASGGTILKSRRVTGFESHDGVVTAAIDESGEKHRGDIFISNAHPLQTAGLFTGEPGKLAEKYTRMKNTPSLLVLNLCLKPGKVRHKKHNLYWFATENVWDVMNSNDAAEPASYTILHYASREQEEFSASVTITTLMNFGEVEKWAESHRTTRFQEARGSGYEEFKERKARILIGAVSRRFPEIGGAIESYSVATPLTFRDYMGTADGSVYGLQKGWDNPHLGLHVPRFYADNLFLAGQNVNLHGVAGVTFSSLSTCSHILRRNLLHEIAQKTSDR